MKILKHTFLSLLVFSFASVLVILNAGMVNAASVTPTLVSGNPSCADRGYSIEFKIEPPVSGVYPIPNSGGKTVTLTMLSGNAFNWSSTQGWKAVIVKGGNQAYVYKYDPPAESTGDTNLVAPEGKDVSHISFCRDFPTAAHLAFFRVVGRAQAVKLKWQSASELNVVGFNVWRSGRRDGTYIQINSSLVPAANPGTFLGANYVFKDKTAKSGKAYFYKLEVVGTKGTLEWSDVVSARKPATR